MAQWCFRVRVFVVLAAFGASGAFAQSIVRLWNPTPSSLDRGGGPGRDVVAPISVSPADGVTAMDFVFSYDPLVLEPLSVHRTAYTNGFSVSYNLAAPGTITVSMNGATPLAGSGDVAWVLFHVVGSPGAVSNLAWQSAQLNGGLIPSQTENGSAPVLAGATFVSAPDDSQGSPGAQVQVPVSAESLVGVYAIDVRLVFNQNVAQALSVVKAPLTQAMSLTYNIAKPGEVLVSLSKYDDPPVSGTGPLVYVTLAVNGPIGDRTPLNVTRGDLDETPAILDDGLFVVCDDSDGDGDTFTGCTGDCDDGDPLVYPGAAEVCEGLDNDCDGSVDEGVQTPFYRDADADEYGVAEDVLWACSPPAGYVHQAGDCNDADGAIHPGAGEICNNVDDDCDGSADEDVAPPATPPSIRGARLDAATAEFAWAPVAGAQNYDIVRGGLAALRASVGDFTSSVAACLGDGVTLTSFQDSDGSPAGDGAWHLVRAVNCGGPGTYNSGAPGQVGDRDSELAASPIACP